LSSTIKDILIQNECKVRTKQIVTIIANDPARMGELMDCFFSDDWWINQYSSGVVEVVAKKFPALATPFIPEMLKEIKNPKHNAITRNILRIWQVIDIPETYMGEIFERCFNYVSDPKEAIAVRAFSITVCEHICKKYPELNDELQLLLKDVMSYETSPGVLSRARKVMRG
jgi:hypothetical protein